jgi:hypothetical protein
MPTNYLATTQKMSEESLDPAAYRLKLLLGGPTGSGKSTACTTIPGKKLFIDTDGRKEALMGYPDVEVIDCYEPDPKSPTAWMKVEDIKKEIVAQLRKGTLPYSTIIEDGLSSLNRYCMNWALLLNPARAMGGAPVEGHYGAHGVNLMNHILGMIALPIHYVLTCHWNIVEDGGKVIYLPKTWGKQLRTEIPTVFTEVWLATRTKDAGENRANYQLYSAPVGGYDFLKSALNRQEKWWKDPIGIDLDAPAPRGIGALFAKRFGTDGV